MAWITNSHRYGTEIDHEPPEPEEADIAGEDLSTEPQPVPRAVEAYPDAF